MQPLIFFGLLGGYKKALPKFDLNCERSMFTKLLKHLPILTLIAHRQYGSSMKSFHTLQNNKPPKREFCVKIWACIPTNLFWSNSWSQAIINCSWRVLISVKKWFSQTGSIFRRKAIYCFFFCENNPNNSQFGSLYNMVYGIIRLLNPLSRNDRQYRIM